jgi:hypothetical protein
MTPTFRSRRQEGQNNPQNPTRKSGTSSQQSGGRILRSASRSIYTGTSQPSVQETRPKRKQPSTVTKPQNDPGFQASRPISRHPPSTPKSAKPAFPSTPVVYKASGVDPFTTLHHKRDFKLLRFGTEMEGKFLGPMGVDEFLDLFLPNSSKIPTSLIHTKMLDVLCQVNCEKDMYGPFVRIHSLVKLSNCELTMAQRLTKCHDVVLISSFWTRAITQTSWPDSRKTSI